MVTGGVLEFPLAVVTLFAVLTVSPCPSTIFRFISNYIFLSIMVKQISTSKRTQVLQMKAEGKSSRQIGSQLGIHSSTVSRIVQKGSQEAPKPKEGRPRILDIQDEKYICRLASTGKVNTATGISKDLKAYSGIVVSPRTVIRALNRNNIVSKYKKKKPKLSKTHRRKRRDFEIGHRGWSESDWDRVVWSDETKICLNGSDGRERTLVIQGERWRDHNIIPTQKLAGGQ